MRRSLRTKATPFAWTGFVALSILLTQIDLAAQDLQGWVDCFAVDDNDHSCLPPINLSNAVQAAKGHPMAVVAKLNVEAAKKNSEIVRANLLPSGTAGYGITNFQNPTFTVGHR